MAELSHRERVPGARLVWLFRAAPVQRALVSAGRRVPGRSVRWGTLRRLRPFSDRYGYDRGTPIERYSIERFLSEYAQRICENVLEVKDALHPSFRVRDAPPTWSTSTGTTATPACTRT